MPCRVQAGRSRVQGAMGHLSDDCLLVAEVGRRLRSADTRTCVVPRSRTQFGDSFAVARPRV